MGSADLVRRVRADRVGAHRPGNPGQRALPDGRRGLEQPGGKTQEAFTHTGVSPAYPVEIDSGYDHTQSQTIGDTGFRRSLVYGASGFEVTSTPDDIGRLAQRDLRLPGASSAFGHAAYTWSGGVSLMTSLSLDGAGGVDRAVVLDGYRRLDTLTHTVTGPSAAIDARTFAWSPAGELLERGYTKQGAGVGDMFNYENHRRLIGSNRVAPRSS